jgi:NAD(P)H-nitrite reductase large subunit
MYLGSRTATKLKVAGVEVASMGLHGPELDTDEHVVFSEPSRGVFKSIVVRDNKMVGATLLGDSRKVAYLTQAYDRGTAPARGTDRADVRPRRARRGHRSGRAQRRRAGVQLQRR